MRSRIAPLLLLTPLTLPAQASDTERDPTAWPPALRSAVAAAQAAQAASGAGAGDTADNAIRQVVFAGGRGYVVQRGRRYAVGESMDGARIERITEQAVWLREPSGQLRREPLYGGVEKRPHPAAAAPAPAASGAKKSKEKP